MAWGMTKWRACPLGLRRRMYTGWSLAKLDMIDYGTAPPWRVKCRIVCIGEKSCESEPVSKYGVTDRFTDRFMHRVSCCSEGT